MTMICTPEYLDRAAKENPDMTFLEYMAMLQVRRITGRNDIRRCKRICTNGTRLPRLSLRYDTPIKIQ